MTIRGHWANGRYVPEPSVQSFEIELGKWLARRPCDSCGKPLGSEPRKMLNHKQYHPTCVVTLDTDISVLPT